MIAPHGHTKHLPGERTSNPWVSWHQSSWCHQTLEQGSWQFCCGCNQWGPVNWCELDSNKKYMTVLFASTRLQFWKMFHMFRWCHWSGHSFQRCVCKVCGFRSAEVCQDQKSDWWSAEELPRRSHSQKESRHLQKHLSINSRDSK